ncbi:uncharacterized protein LOC108886321 isoform X2 [Lates calcarifer]|uniref:Uncharacterized protein LOC108886321 isoform X2 n=1 Tax=Lates calcarifer TaxID=8187 RepID=A0AAJ7V5I3_LATCA|nr:uncharacterized protein LOC108886321 isoform X2 [Lates calcarifer]
MQTLNITGHVGKRVSFVCSDWNTWTNVKSNVKYLCISPCTADKHIIIKAESGRTKRKDRIELINRGQDLFVSITHLQMSDSKKYFCGVERPGLDLLREVNLKVTDGPRTTVKTVTVDSTVSFTDMSSSTMSSGSSDITNLPMSYTTAPAASGAGNALYLTLGLIFIISIAVVLLILVRKMMKKQLMVVTTPQEDIGEALMESTKLFTNLVRIETRSTALSHLSAGVQVLKESIKHSTHQQKLKTKSTALSHLPRE